MDNYEMCDKFYIWSIEHNAWWKWGRQGYTNKKTEAGHYGYFEACQIVEDANKYRGDKHPNEAMIRV
jgi:hypothetical protein